MPDIDYTGFYEDFDGDFFACLDGETGLYFLVEDDWLQVQEAGFKGWKLPSPVTSTIRLPKEFLT